MFLSKNLRDESILGSYEQRGENVKIILKKSAVFRIAFNNACWDDNKGTAGCVRKGKFLD